MAHAHTIFDAQDRVKILTAEEVRIHLFFTIQTGEHCKDHISVLFGAVHYSLNYRLVAQYILHYANSINFKHHNLLTTKIYTC